jgi:hypothetical protein
MSDKAKNWVTNALLLVCVFLWNLPKVLPQLAKYQTTFDQVGMFVAGSGLLGAYSPQLAKLLQPK